MNDSADSSDAQRTLLAERIVHCMRSPMPPDGPGVVFDRQGLRILAIGDGPPDTHAHPDAVHADHERFAVIPGRDRIDTVEHIAAFLQDEYAPDDPARHREACGALQDAASPSTWRARLGDGHAAVQAFDAYMLDFHRVVARMLMHGSRHPRVGVLGTDRMARARRLAPGACSAGNPDITANHRTPPPP